MGLAWTSSGGGLLIVESAITPGKGVLQLSGSLGEVIKEASQLALTWVKANIHRWDTSKLKFQFESSDIHIHFPAGSTPKDGPSAGVTTVVSLMSLLLNIPIADRLAMSGEISLRGVVLPVGGIKEKVLAAHRAGIKSIILPSKNAKEVKKDIPENIRKCIHFFFVDTLVDALKHALPNAQLVNTTNAKL